MYDKIYLTRNLSEPNFTTEMTKFGCYSVYKEDYAMNNLLRTNGGIAQYLKTSSRMTPTDGLGRRSMAMQKWRMTIGSSLETNP
jgi:hypothetical protein